MLFSGYGVFATCQIPRGSFLFEYIGDYITKEEGEARLMSESGPGYLFFFGRTKW